MKKKIAIIHGPLVIGGAEKSLINLLHFIDYSKYDVSLWLKDGSGEMQDQIDSRVTVRYWEEHLNQNYRNYLKRLLKEGRLFRLTHSVVCRWLSRFYVDNWHRNFKYYIQALPLLSEEKYDIAISYHSLVKEDLMILDYALRAKKKIGWIHGTCRHEHDDPYFESFPIEYKKLDHVFCVSNMTRELFLEKYPEMKTKTSVMYNLQNFDEIRRLALERIPEPFDGVTLVTVGRLSAEKGQTMIPEIARHLLDMGYHFTWYIIGDGPEKDTIEQEIAAWNVEKTVRLLGVRLNPYPYIYKADFYILPSFSEGFCVTTFEAKTLNTPVVTTNVPGIREQFADGEAVICASSVDSLVNGISFALDNTEKLRYRSAIIPADYNEKEIQKLYEIIE